MPDLILKTLAILGALSGWILLALTIALGVVLFAPSPPGIDLESIRREWGGWIFIAQVVFGFLTLARFAQWAAATIWSALQRHRKGVEEEARRNRYESDVLAQLDTLSSEERDVLRYLVQHNQRTAVGVLHFGSLHTLRTKGLLEVQSGILTPLKAPHTVPDFVWDALLEREDELFGADI